jgi:hypothetical protein
MNKPMMKLAALAAGLIGVVALFGACDNGTSPSLPTLKYGVQLEDQTSGALNEGHIGIMNTVLDNFETYGNKGNAIRDKNIKIVVILGNSISRSNNVITIGIDHWVDAPTLQGIIGPYIDEIIAQVLNTNIRLANGGTQERGNAKVSVTKICLT